MDSRAIESILRRRARRGYELARLRRALPLALVVVPLAALSHTCCIEPTMLWACCAAAFTVLLASLWRGEALGAGARAGLLAGAASWVLPVAASTLGFGFTQVVLALCLAGGVVSGLLVGLQLRRREHGALGFLLAAALVSGLTGALGCVVAGAGGVLGMLAGELIGAAPLLVLAALRR